jgi:hypothetical protein
MSFVKNKTKSEILEEMAGTAQPGSQIHEQQKAAIIVPGQDHEHKSFN